MHFLPLEEVKICVNKLHIKFLYSDRSYQRASNLLVLLASLFRSISYFLSIRLDNLDLLSSFLKIKQTNLTFDHYFVAYPWTHFFEIFVVISLLKNLSFFKSRAERTYPYPSWYLLVNFLRLIKQIELMIKPNHCVPMNLSIIFDSLKHNEMFPRKVSNPEIGFLADISNADLASRNPRTYS